MSLKMNKKPHLLKVGDTVVTKFHSTEKDVIRRITSIQKYNKQICGSGWMATADGGGECPHCRREYGTPVHLIDAAWFIPAKEGK